MEILGLITEYNPFHNGHAYHIEQAKAKTGATHTIAVMSGQFVQRGEPAIFDKWTRARAALLNGIDLVLELPTVYATSSAEYFAGGAIRLLNDLQVVDHVVFGSESDNIEIIDQVAKLLLNEPPAFQEALKDHLQKGMAYPKARQLALEETLSGKNIPVTPNDILGIEYVKAIHHLSSPIKPHTIKRIGAGYHDLDVSKHISSATGIRKAIHEGDIGQALSSVPNSAQNMYEHHIKDAVHPASLFNYLQYHLLTHRPDSLLQYPDVSEGFENTLAKAFIAEDYDALLARLKSKRYTQTRIQRILLSIFLQKSKSLQDQASKLTDPLYARVLGFTPKGQEIIRAIKGQEHASLVTKPHKFTSDNPVLEQMNLLDQQATDLYSLLSETVSFGDDCRRQPVQVK